MSAETKEAAKHAAVHLKEANKHLEHAGDYAKSAGDPSLIQKVTKLREATSQTSQELDHKLNEGRKP